MLPIAPSSGDASVSQGNNGLFHLRKNQSLLSRPGLRRSISSLNDTSQSHASSAESPRKGSGESTPSQDAIAPLPLDARNETDDPREIILQSFLPTVAVYASADTEELIRLKGVYGGLCGLLKPFGERIQGKVVIRDSVGASRSWENFGIHFVEFGPKSRALVLDRQLGEKGDESEFFSSQPLSASIRPIHLDSQSQHNSTPIDEIVRRHLFIDGQTSQGKDSKLDLNARLGSDTRAPVPPYYAHYLRKLLANRPMVAHETLSHPVACIIAISSQSSSPIETLRELYGDTRQGEKRVPAWAGNEYLRYYILVHDEEQDDIAKSTALFEQMKKHFGLHCHLLRLKSSECGPDRHDGIELPLSSWPSAEDEFREVRQKDGDFGLDDLQPHIFESDAAAIRTFIREMATQSVVPFMEGRVTAWNDQVASRRRGISGRFMSLSKRWTGFGTSRGIKSSSANSVGSSGCNYDSAQGFYAPDSPEATMHRLADYAFMLRDWKLASSIYEILRTDFGDDKVWRYHAAASEMAAISLLFSAPITGLRSTIEAVDQMLDAASYSYITRCANPPAAVRCLVLAVELLRSRGGTAAEDAAKWAARLLELRILSPLAQVLVAERLAVCCASRLGIGRLLWGSRHRKAAFWSLLASELWLSSNNIVNAKARFQDASALYGIPIERDKLPSFSGMHDVWQRFGESVDNQNDPPLMDASIVNTNGIVDEESEQFGTDDCFRNTARPMALGSSGPPPSGIYSMAQQRKDLGYSNDGFS
ncbi:MAG: hypothetical protein Q9187_002657 [Circinaria calcarea]